MQDWIAPDSFPRELTRGTKMKSKKVKFKPLKFICRDCGVEIQSITSGQFSYCDCPEDDYIFIDQTYGKNGGGYVRRGGRPEKFIKIEE